MKTLSKPRLERRDCLGFDWIFDLTGTLERMLDRLDSERS